MGKNKIATCNVCFKQMRSDTLKRHLNTHKNISRYPKKKCSICNKQMIAWNLERHLKTHNNSEKNIVEAVTSDQNCYTEKEITGKIVQNILETGDVDPKSLSKQNIRALTAYTLSHKKQDLPELNGWQKELLPMLKPTHRQIIWVTGEEGAEGKTWFQNYIEEYFGSKRVFRTSLDRNTEAIYHALSKRTLPLIDVFVFNLPRSFCRKLWDIPYTIFENLKDGRAISTKYDSKVLDFKTPNIVIIFSNDIAQWNRMSKDRWLKIRLIKSQEGFVISKR